MTTGACSSWVRHGPEQPAPGFAALPWSDALVDVDCRSLVPDAGLSDAEYQRSCGLADQTPAGAQSVDELNRRLLWNLFTYFTEPPYDAWRRQTDTYSEWVASNSSSAAARMSALAGASCEHVAQTQLAAFTRPIWFGARDFAADGGGSSPPAPPTQPIWDQNGNLVEFEGPVYDQPTFSELALNTVQGQVAALCRPVLLRAGAWGTLFSGSGRPPQVPVHLKLAWREIISDADCDYHFVTRSGRPCAKGEQGLVAAHIVAKTNTQGDYWLWGSFSHASNVAARGGLAPLFRDPSCTSCRDNVCPTAVGSVRKTQVARLTPIAPEVAKTKATGLANGHIPERLASYDLIGSQRLPGIVGPGTQLPLPRPDVLSNEIIEWDRQDSSCIGCHSRARIATIADATSFCADPAHVPARYCQTHAQQPGACQDANCGSCRELTRAARFFTSPTAKPYPYADMAWTYDHYWKDTQEAP